MAIEFPCPTCRQQVRTPDAAAGKKGRCPNCGTVVIIPAPVAVVAPGSISVSQPQPPPSPPVATSTSPPPIEFPCPQCQQTVRTPASVAGKKGKCPHCQAVVQIPGKTAPASPPPTAPPPVLPKPPRDELPTLTPLPGLVPIPSDTIPTLAPLPADPLAGLAPASPLGIPTLKPSSAFNPYASPAATSYSQPAYQPRRYHDGNRPGLPWENEASMDTFGDTMSEVLGSPGEAFQRMRRGGGIANPMGYFIVGGVIGQIATAIYSTIIRAIVFATMGEGPFPFEGLLILGAMELIGGIFGVILGGVIGMFITAAIWHVCLLMVGGGHAGYEATYRALCFGLGSTAVLNAIPIVGPLIGIFYIFVVLIHAFTHTHEMGGGQAALAVFLPLLLFCCLCLAPAGFLSLGGLLSCLEIIP